ncbi:MAG TPA: polysaccharide biosynthesis tyrosine autokinase [Iamia sp.]|nr:polysaccharide biosynthesis tyrosine autokinase [Iamia sp.]
METSAPPELDLRRYIDIVRRRKVAIAVVVIVTVGLAVLLSARQTPVYEAKARILLDSTAADELLGATGSSRSGSVVATEIQVMDSEAVREAVRAELGRAPKVSFEAVGDTSVVAITASSSTAERAAEDANAYAEGYIGWRRDSTTTELEGKAESLREDARSLSDQLAFVEAPLQQLEDQIAALPPQLPGEPVSPERAQLTESRDALAAEISEDRNSLQARILTNQQEIDRVEQALSLLSSGGSEVLTPARAPGSPVSPQPVRNAALALVIGLVLGIGLALVLEVLDDRIRRKEDLSAAAGGRSVLGLIPLVGKRRRRARRRSEGGSVVSIDAPTSPAAEAYRTLRTSLQFLSVDAPVRIIQVTSPSAAEGKSTTVANLGVALARAGQRVAVVCCDLRRPRIHEYFGLDNAVGFTSVLLSDATIDEALQEVPGESRLHLLASGPPPPNPAELLSARRTRDVLDHLSRQFDVVLVDTPPVLPVTDALLLSSVVDVTILVGQAGSTTKRAARRAVELLEQVDADLVGCVLNGVALGGGYGYGGYGYGYGYGANTYESVQSRGRTGRGKTGRRPSDVPLERVG